MRSWQILLPAGFAYAIGVCVVAAVAFPEPAAQVVLSGAAVAAFGVWARHYLAAPLTGVMVWCFTTGFLVHGHGELAFGADDLTRLAAFVSVGLAGSAVGYVHHVLRRVPPPSPAVVLVPSRRVPTRAVPIKREHTGVV